MSDSYDPLDYSPSGSSVHGILQARMLDLGCHSLLQGIFLTQGLDLPLLQWQADSLPLSHLGSPDKIVFNLQSDVLMEHVWKTALNGSTQYSDTYFRPR